MMGDLEANQEATTNAALSDEREVKDEPDSHGEARTDTGLAGERETREVNRAGQRADTDQALAGERGYTDRFERSEQTLAAWRAEHADDAGLGEQTPAKNQSLIPSWLNFAMVLLVLAWMAVITSQVIVSSARVSEINRRQITSLQQQNDLQLCVQHDLVTAIRKIGLKLGLPVEDIQAPDVSLLNCPTP